MVWDVVGITMFTLVGAAFVLVTLVAGHFVRPRNPDPVKGDIYECGEKTIGPGWVQFDLRFYVVALLFVIFDVEIALLYPWARVMKDCADVAFWDLLFFLGLLLVGYAFLWKHGYLDWVRSKAAHGPPDRPTAGKDGERN